MSKIQEIKDLFRHYGLSANHNLGQNFLISETVYSKILEAADLKPDDTVIEVGPGTGFLTEKLVDRVKKVIAVEFDAGMVRLLRERFLNVKNLEIVHSDIMKFWIQDSGVKNRQYKVVANIPYYITSPLIKLFLQSECQPTSLVVLVQKEVAERVCGLIGNGVLTFETQLFGTPKIIATVPPGAFWPSPTVDSAILQITVHPKPLLSKEETEQFIRLIKFGFGQRRKKLSNSLESGLRLEVAEVRTLLVEAGIDPHLRAEALAMEDWLRLARVLTKILK